MSQHFRASSEFIERALGEGHSVLVHCQQGISRSSTLLIAFLMHSRRMGLAEAYTLVRSARAVAKPKANFLRQLVRFGNELEAARLHAQNLADAQTVKAAVQQNVKALEEARTATDASSSAAGAGAAAVPAGPTPSAAPAPAAAAAAAAPAASPPTASPVGGTHSPLEAVDVAPGLFIMNAATAATSTGSALSTPPNPVDVTEGPRRERALQRLQERSEAAPVKRKQGSMDAQAESAQAVAGAGAGAAPGAVTPTGAGTGAADVAGASGSDSDSGPGDREAANMQKRRRIIKHAEAAADVAAEAQMHEAARSASASPPIVAPLTQLNLDQLAPPS